MLPSRTPEEIVERLDAERARLPGPVVLATDADGTLWEGDVGFDVFEALLAEGVRDAAREALAEEARSIGVEADGDATDLGRRLYRAYTEDRYPHDRAFGMMAWAFAGWRVDEARAFADRVFSRTKLDQRVRPAFEVIVGWARRADVPVFVVSASPAFAVQSGVTRLGIPPERVVGMMPAMREGAILPALDGPLVYGEGKLQALARHGVGGGPDAHAILGAFGDSAWDAPMLRAARVPVAVSPARALLDLAASIPGLVSLAT